MTIGHDDGPIEQPKPAPAPKPGRMRWLVLGLGLVALLIGVWIVNVGLPVWLTQPGTIAPTGSDAAGTGAETRRIQATLFYVSDDGTQLVPTSRNVPYAATQAEQARRLVEAQVATAPEGLLSPIPAGTIVRAVFITDSREAYVDLGGTILSGHSGGSLDEALTVYAIVNAITTNLPEVTAVQILIEGREVDSLRGHIDLRAPLAKSLDWVQKGPSPQ